MYKFYETFAVSDDRNVPYSLTEENLHQYTDPSGRSENGRFFFAREGARFCLNAPKLKSFDLKCKLGFVPPADAFCKFVSWAFYLGYNPEKHSGKVLAVTYYESELKLVIELYNMQGKKLDLICEDVKENIKLDADIMYDFEIASKDGALTGSFNYMSFCFPYDIEEGKIAFSNKRSIKGLLFSDLYVQSDEAEYEIVSDKKYIIPHYDGGSENYVMHIIVKKYSGGTYKVSYSLTGGADSMHTKDYKMAIWSVQYDIFTNPYIRFYGKKDKGRLYLRNGELRFIEQNETYINTRLVLDNEKTPFKGSFYLDEFDEDGDFAFGYDMFRHLGNELQEGQREFLYRDEVLIYSGTPLSEDYVITVESPKNKKMASFIPADIDEFDKALFHAQNNHYFMPDEDVRFKITSYVRKNVDFTEVKITLLDAFYNEIKKVEMKEKNVNSFFEYGFTATEYDINLGSMSQSVYHLKVELVMGDETVCSHVSAFEVFDDSDISPRASSGIPFMYSGEGAPANIVYNCPDPWIIKPDHNEIHYIDCVLAVPEVAENRKGWEILKLYKREMFLWANERTIPRGKTYNDYPKSLKVADYLAINDDSAPILYYSGYRKMFKMEAIKRLYNSFKEEHKNYDLFDMPDDGDVPEEDYVKFFRHYGSEWLDYMNEKNSYELFSLYDSIREKYPQIKFSHYGPYNMYGTRHSGIRRTKLSFKPVEHASKMMDGFWYFEDYPFITAQATHYSAWGMKGLLLYMPDANIVVELFSSFDPVCPDGFVFYAFPPMGEVYVESYRTVTQVYENMYAAAFRDGKFKYYDRPGFQFLQSYNTEASKRFEEFLKCWGVYLKNKPSMSMKAPSFVMEYINDDDRYDFDFSDRDSNNISQSGQAYVHEIMAEAGLPKGFVTNYDGLLALDETMTDVCVIPSLKYATDAVKNKIRDLSKKGVALIGISDVSDLEDVFGIERYDTHGVVCSMESDSESEIITNRDVEFFYKANGAEVLLWLNDKNNNRHPFIFRKGKNIFINSYISHAGCAEFTHDSFGVANVSKLLRTTMTKIVKEISAPLATSDNNCGINLFVNEHGEKMVLLTDFTFCGNKESKMVTVKFNFDVEDVECVCHKDMTIKPNLVKKDGKLKAFTVTLRPGESGLFKIR